MKKAIILTLIAALLLSGCQAREEEAEPATTDYTSNDLAAAIIESQDGLPPLYPIEYGDGEFEAYSTIYLGDLSRAVVGGVICYPFGVEASEVVVFEFTSPEKAEDAVEPLEDYIASRAAAFFGYAPEESALAGDGVALSEGDFAALFICASPRDARRAFLSAFGDDAPEPPDLYSLVADPPEQEPEPGPAAPDDEYDHDAVLSAFETGDTSALTPMNLEVYDACQKILDSVLTPGMTDVQKELAINDYLVYHIEYDPLALDHSDESFEPESDNPYGALVHGYAICRGYASSFKLLMDIVGINCVTVEGFAHNWEEEHAWNEVELDGEWYCVDVTWNDPVFTGWTPDDATRLEYARSYFNVTSAYMRSTDHQWSDPDAPEATGTKYAFAG